MARGSFAHNAHSVEFTSPKDALWHLEAAGWDAGRAAGLLERLSGRFLKLEAVGPRAAERMRQLLVELGGELVARPPAAGRGGRRVDAILCASRGTMRRLAERLRGEPFGLPAVSREIEACLREGNRILRWAGRVLDFRQRALVMGILNCTPDSFYPGSRAAGPEEAVDRAREMIADGADILDVGGESTRPGAGVVEAGRELERILPVIQAIRRESDILVSVDTRKSEVAGPALEAGADLINDISALRHDPRMVGLAAERGVPVVLMHMRGTPETMQQLARYEDTVSEVIRELRSAIDSALEGGISPERIIVDPGIGFGKTAEDNLRILKHLSSFTSLGYPLLVGLSRKSFLGHITGRPVEERLAGTIAAGALAVLGGADILRVHDVREAVETVRVIDAVRQAAG